MQTARVEEGADVELLLAGVAFIAAEVTKTLADEVTSDLWARVKKAWADRFGEDPKPEGLTLEGLEEVVQGDAGLSGELAERLGNSPVFRRLTKVRQVLDGARLLWIDDHPQWNAFELRCLELAGVRVRTAETTRTALALLADHYDLVLSDIDREGDTRVGLEALPRLHQAAPATPVVFYVAKLADRGVPAGALGITNRPDELLHLVMDALERTRW